MLFLPPMSAGNPLSDDEIEMMLHEIARQLADARMVRKAETPEGDDALKIALVGPYSALLRLARGDSPIKDQDAP